MGTNANPSPKPPLPPALLQYARQMRHEGTDAEAKLWWLLRDRHLAGFKFRRQTPIGGYILDFYCHEAKLGIELDGGQHSEAERAQYDEGRTEALGKLGIRILRFWDNDMLECPDVLLEHIYDVLMQLDAGRPHPDPLPKGEGEDRTALGPGSG